MFDGIFSGCKHGGRKDKESNITLKLQIIT